MTQQVPVGPSWLSVVLSLLTYAGELTSSFPSCDSTEPNFPLLESAAGGPLFFFSGVCTFFGAFGGLGVFAFKSHKLGSHNTKLNSY